MNIIILVHPYRRWYIFFQSIIHSLEKIWFCLFYCSIKSKSFIQMADCPYTDLSIYIPIYHNLFLRLRLCFSRTLNVFSGSCYQCDQICVTKQKHVVTIDLNYLKEIQFPRSMNIKCSNLIYFLRIFSI